MNAQPNQKLLSALRSEDPKKQAGALAKLKKHPRMGFLSEVLPLLTSPDAFIRGSASETLGYLGGAHLEEVGPKLLQMLFDFEDFVRNGAAKAFGLLPPYLPAVEPLCIRLLDQEEDILVRVNCSESLGYMGYSQAIPALFTVCRSQKDEEILVRAYAASSLGLLGNQQLLPKLHQLLKQETSDRVKMELLLACIRLGDRPSIEQFKQWMEQAEDLLVAGANAFSFLLEYQPTSFIKEHEVELRTLFEELNERCSHYLERSMNEFIEQQKISSSA